MQRFSTARPGAAVSQRPIRETDAVSSAPAAVCGHDACAGVRMRTRRRSQRRGGRGRRPAGARRRRATRGAASATGRRGRGRRARPRLAKQLDEPEQRRLRRSAAPVELRLGREEAADRRHRRGRRRGRPRPTPRPSAPSRARAGCVYASTNVVVDPAVRPRGSAQPRITSANAVSTRISYRRAARRSERDGRNGSSGITARCSGDHQTSSPSTRIGNSAEPVGGEERAGLEVGPEPPDVVRMVVRRALECPGGGRGLDRH